MAFIFIYVLQNLHIISMTKAENTHEYQLSHRLTPNNIRKLERKLNYSFKNKQLLIQAFIKSSIKRDCSDQHSHKISNDTLEYIGDRVLYSVVTKFYYQANAVISDDGYLALPSAASSTNWESKKTANAAWCNIMDKKENRWIKKMIIVGPNRLLETSPKASKIWADLFEAIFGAIAMDSNFDMDVLCNSFVSFLKRKVGCGLRKLIESDKEIEKLNAKQLLQLY